MRRFVEEVRGGGLKRRGFWVAICRADDCKYQLRDGRKIRDGLGPDLLSIFRLAQHGLGQSKLLILSSIKLQGKYSAQHVLGQSTPLSSQFYLF